MARVTIEREGFLELVSSWDGASKRIRIVSCVGRTDTGAILNTQFSGDWKPRAILNVSKQSVKTAEFDTGEDRFGQIAQTDTGVSSDTVWLIYMDTGQV